jgi:hypothetical protein
MDRSDLPSEEEQCEVEVPAALPAGDLLAPAVPIWTEGALPGHEVDNKAARPDLFRAGCLIMCVC